MILDVEFSVQEMLYLLFFPRFAFSKEFDAALSLVIAELRVPAAPEVRHQLTKTTFIPKICPATSGRLGHSDIIGCLFDRSTLVQPLDEGEALAHLLIICLREQAVEIVLTQVTDDLFFLTSHDVTDSEYTQTFCESL